MAERRARREWSKRRGEVRELLKRREREGWTLKELAEAAGIPLPTLNSWVQRLRREESLWQRRSLG
jgi:DNA-directed RNA polymerase specialized sigma24 family protein